MTRPSAKGKRPAFCLSPRCPRGHSSAGRAPAWHAGGQEFESPWLHPVRLPAAQGVFSFVQAAPALWRDPALLEIPARPSDETRFLVVARLHGRHWFAVITYRQQVICLISVRRSRPEEGESVIDALDISAARRPRLGAS
jgi:uncharacterized DUF497 family protein